MSSSKLLYVFFFISVFVKGQEYLDSINIELSKANNDKNIITEIANTELKKFEKTKDSLYYFSYQFAVLHSYNLDESLKIKQFILATELVRLNNNKYVFLTINANYNIALQLEYYSPKLSLKFLDDAIKGEMTKKSQTFLPHLLHLKGRIYYNLKEYEKAKEYFKKSLNLFKPSDYLFVSSMHNNFGLVYKDQKKYNIAEKEFKKAISILDEKKELTVDENNFKYLIIRNLGDNYFLKNDYKSAQVYYEQEFNKYKSIKNYYWDILDLSNKLIDVYHINNEKEKENQLIDFIIENQKNFDFNDITLDINLKEILLKHYVKIGDKSNIEVYAKKLIELNHELQNENKKKFAEISNILNENIILNTNQKYTYEILNQKRKNNWLIFTGILIFIFFIFISWSILMKKKKEKELFSKQNLINHQNNLLLKQTLDLQNEKIKNLHLNLNLKKETEKVFLDKLKKVRKSNSKKTEEVLKDLHLELNNLIGIDKSFNQELSSFQETKDFTNNLSSKYPLLSNQELQLCVYFRLNLTAKEISILEKLAVETIWVYKSKIKSKLGLTKEDSLENFLNSF